MVGIPIYVAVAQAVASSVAAKKQADAQKKAAALQSTATTHAADIAGQSNAEMIQFLKEQEAARAAEAQKTQDLNYQQYQEDLARRKPYMDMGLGALAQMGRPRPMAGATNQAPYQPLAGGAYRANTGQAQVTQTPAPTGSLADYLAQQKGA